MDFGAIIVSADLDEAVEIANDIAPEHLELLVAEPVKLVSKIENAGAIFLGSPIAGDGGRLRRRPEPRIADRRHRTVLLAAFRLRFLKEDFDH